MKIRKKVVRLGIDLGKNNFDLSGVDEAGTLVIKKKLLRKQLVTYLANVSPCLVGMEACAGSHHWAREIEKLGHEARLMSPQFVKPYVKSNKNDYNDAEGICEAVSRPGMRFVSIKAVEQQDVQALHRMRQLVVKYRTALANQIRGLLGEFGIVIAKGIGHIPRRVPEILEDTDNGLSERFRGWLVQVWEDFISMGRRIGLYDKQIRQLYDANEACQRIGAIAGIDPQMATAIISTFGDGKQFSRGRQFAASLGLVPRQHTTGGKPHLLGISKRGDKYIRTLLIHGARSVISRVEGKSDKRSCWLQSLIARWGHNRATVALANKNARIIWALLSRGDSYRTAT